MLKEREEGATKNFNEAEASKTDKALEKDDDPSASNIQKLEIIIILYCRGNR